MKLNHLFMGLFCLVSIAPLPAQLTDVESLPHCFYTQQNLREDLYLMGEDERVDQIVSNICEAAGIERNFTLSAANVPTVALIRDESGDYLLYSMRFVRSLLEEAPELLYFVLAHEIGHLYHDHKLNGDFRLREESVADEFTGQLLYRLAQFSSREQVLFYGRQLSFTYAGLYPEGMRTQIIGNGWDRAEGIVRSNQQLAYLEEQKNRAGLPLPVFKIRGCPRFKDMAHQYLKQCGTLKDFDSMLTSALDRLGYEQRSYFGTPNGFALLTAVEQIDEEGSPLPGRQRWQDYPATKDFDGLMDYLSALILPRKGYFRLFVFLVADRNAERGEAELSSSSARAWLRAGGYRLPEEIGQLPVSSRHKCTVLLYEFEVPASDSSLEEHCDQFLSVRQHLDRSGLAKNLK